MFWGLIRDPAWLGPYDPVDKLSTSGHFFDRKLDCAALEGEQTSH